MVSATIKFAIATSRLSDKKEERELEHRAVGSAEEDEAGGGEQDLYAEEGHNTEHERVRPHEVSVLVFAPLS